MTVRELVHRVAGGTRPTAQDVVQETLDKIFGTAPSPAQRAEDILRRRHAPH